MAPVARRILLVLFPLLLAACGREVFPGFRPVDADVHYKLRTLGDAEKPPSDSDSVLVRVRMAVHGEPPGSLFSTEGWFAHVGDVLPESAESVRFCEGDSVSLVARARRVPWNVLGAERSGLADTAWIDVEVALRGTRSRAQSRAITEELRWARTAAIEDSALARFFRASPDEWHRFMGIYHVLGAGNPKRPKARSGQVVTIGYIARSLEDGRVLDDTYASGQHLTFRLGDPGQVIDGVDIAVHLLPKGGKGRFVIPSRLGFGAEGSSGRIVPPFTPLLYQLELLDATGRPSDTLTVDSAVVSR